jgi:hypothetical protein
MEYSAPPTLVCDDLASADACMLVVLGFEGDW